MIVSNVKINLEKLMKSKERAVVGLTKGIEGLFKKNGVSSIADV
jgi:pyruvate/2-oxoglutarate dehydrogenase complex dihydrolipoamide dehydrogenase (E3) component